MSKVQTLDEYLEAHPSMSLIERALARMVWSHAHENAALVCEGQSLTTQPDECADAIREAGKS